MSAEIVNQNETEPTANRPQPEELDTFILKFSELEVPKDRGRKDFGDLKEFAAQINVLGLLNPLVVRKLPSGKYQLTAGERRLRAMMMLGWSQSPVTVKTDYEGNDLLAKMAELSENVDRKSMDMIEQAILVKQIDDLKKQIHGEGGRGQKDKGWNNLKTAAFVKQDPSYVSAQIRLARHLELHPEKKEALAKLDISTALRRIKQDEHTVKTHSRIDTGQLKLSDEIKLGDAVVLIKTLEDNSQHLLLTDPPFGLEEIQSTLGGTKGTSGTYTALLSESDNATLKQVLSMMEKLLPEFFRVLKPSSHLYIFSSGELLIELIPMMKSVGFVLNENILIWDKKKTTTPFKGLEYPSAYEPIIFAHKPPREKHLLLPDCSNILRYSSLHSSKKIHRFQKPTDLISHLIRNSSNIGDNVLDPFAGSGVIPRVAKELKRNALGFELDRDNWARAQIVLSEGVVKAQEIFSKE